MITLSSSDWAQKLEQDSAALWDTVLRAPGDLLEGLFAPDPEREDAQPAASSAGARRPPASVAGALPKAARKAS